MKRYIIWIGIVYIVLLLLPLPVLGKLKPDKDPQLNSGDFSSKSNNKKDKNNNELFRLLDTDTNTVYEVSVKEFVTGSVGAEMYPTYHTEALKAQAVASYTYYSVLRKRQRANPNANLKGADFADMVSGFPVYNTNNQLKERWGKNYDTYYKKISDTVNSVLGKMITYDGEPITAVYHAISTGTTEDAAVMWGTSYPYLQPVASPGDKLSPSYQSNISFKSDKLKSELSKIKGLTFSGTADKWLDKNIQTSSSGTVTQLKICNTSLTGSQIREALGLRSANFTVEYRDGSFHFTVYGYGHNVGMSQYGADYLARQGLSYEEILHYYYTDVEIK
ncbi:MAG: stage II sporulation protein D [Oscillospiraceae bacterium]|nr:stage II sporulation protein D [Oscillospiraceae bacterium]MDD4414849.1 stage II sporulation protein D [Oscillospiraceae bacterium]